MADMAEMTTMTSVTHMKIVSRYIYFIKSTISMLKNQRSFYGNLLYFLF